MANQVKKYGFVIDPKRCIDCRACLVACRAENNVPLDDTRIYVSGTPKPGTSLGQLEDAIDAVLAEIAEKGVTAEELERAKTRLIADAVYAQDSQATLARWYGAALTTGGSVAQIQSWPDRMRAATVEQVRDAARRWFDKRRSVTGYLVKELQPAEKRP